MNHLCLLAIQCLQSIALCFPCFDFHCFPYACSLLISVLVGRWWVHELLVSLSAGGTGGFSVIIASGGPSTCYLFSLEDNFFLLISNCLSQFKVLPQYLCGLVLTFERACKHYHYFRVECCIGIFTTPYTTRPLFRLKKISTRWIVPLSFYLANIVQSWTN
jgi:hypothetical protein